MSTVLVVKCLTMRNFLLFIVVENILSAVAHRHAITVIDDHAFPLRVFPLEYLVLAVQ